MVCAGKPPRQGAPPPQAVPLPTAVGRLLEERAIEYKFAYGRHIWRLYGRFDDVLLAVGTAYMLSVLGGRRIGAPTMEYK